MAGADAVLRGTLLGGLHFRERRQRRQVLVGLPERLSGRVVRDGRRQAGGIRARLLHRGARRTFPEGDAVRLVHHALPRPAHLPTAVRTAEHALRNRRTALELALPSLLDGAAYDRNPR